MSPCGTQFIALLRKVLPDLALEDVLWRYNYMVGCIIYAMGGPERMTRLPKGLETTERAPRTKSNDAIEQLVAVAVAGFRSPSCVGKPAAIRQPRSRNRA